jgi:aminoglycoside phosphotransferase (APT) family kinase protein
VELLAERSFPGRPKRDRALDERIALSAVHEQLPALACGTARHLGSGWGFDVYLLDDRYIARFPRTASIAEEIDADESIHRFVNSLSLPFSTPAVVAPAQGGSYFPHRFLVFAYVPGIPSERWVRPSPRELAGDLGLALTRIHSASVREAQRAGVPGPDQSELSTQHCFLHGDFGGGNIILHPETGRLAGVIDWGNSQIGDPATDFVWLALDRGWTFTREVLGAYQLPVRDEFLDDIRVHAQALAKQCLADAIERGFDLTLQEGWLRNAFSVDT